MSLSIKKLSCLYVLRQTESVVYKECKKTAIITSILVTNNLGNMKTC